MYVRHTIYMYMYIHTQREIHTMTHTCSQLYRHKWTHTYTWTPSITFLFISSICCWLRLMFMTVSSLDWNTELCLFLAILRHKMAFFLAASVLVWACTSSSILPGITIPSFLPKGRKEEEMEEREKVHYTCTCMSWNFIIN